MGVWIETVPTVVNSKELRVTPCMGVWIETKKFTFVFQGIPSHTLYGCVD